MGRRLLYPPTRYSGARSYFQSQENADTKVALIAWSDRIKAFFLGYPYNIVKCLVCGKELLFRDKNTFETIHKLGRRAGHRYYCRPDAPKGAHLAYQQNWPAGRETIC